MDRKTPTIKEIVYHYAKKYPWHRRADLSTIISEKTRISWWSAYYTHRNLTRDGVLEKRGASMNTEYRFID